MEDMGKNLTKMLKDRNLSEQYEKLIQEVLNDQDVQLFIEKNKESLNKDSIMKSYAKLYEFVNEKKKYKENSGMMAPGYEPQLIMNYHFIDVSYVPTAELITKQKEQAIKSRIHSMDMPKDVRTATFEQFQITDRRAEAITAAYDFIGDYLENPKSFHQGLYLHGAFGVGKSFLLGAIAHELAEKGYPTTLMHFPSFAVEMKQAIGQNTTGEKLEAVKKASILMLDDIGADSMSSWIRDDVLGVILQYRMQEQLPTFFSSNLDMKHLGEEHLRVTQRGEDEPLKAQRIMERIRYLSRELEMTGANRRLS